MFHQDLWIQESGCPITQRGGRSFLRGPGRDIFKEFFRWTQCDKLFKYETCWILKIFSNTVEFNIYCTPLKHFT